MPNEMITPSEFTQTVINIEKQVCIDNKLEPGTLLEAWVREFNGRLPCRDVPDELDSKRYRKKYRGQNIYIIVAHGKDMIPLEVFVKFDQDGQDPSRWYTEAGWDAFTRFLSGWLRYPDVFKFEKVLAQLERSSRTPGDLPSLVLEVLKEHMEYVHRKNNR